MKNELTEKIKELTKEVWLPGGGSLGFLCREGVNTCKNIFFLFN